MRISASLAWLMAVLSLASPAAAGEARETQTLGKGQEYETTYFVYRGALPGPAVLVQGCIHGNEQSGMRALEKLIGSIAVKAGKLILLPRMNAPACARNVRFVNVDLNRVFAPDVQGGAYEHRLAAEITDLVGRERIEHLLTLHDSVSLHDPLTGKHYGQTICYGVKEKPAYLDSWLEALNREARAPNERFRAFYSPITNSSTEFLVARFGLQGGFCGETWTGLPARRRAALQESMILTFLNSVGVVYSLRGAITPASGAGGKTPRGRAD